MGKALDRLLALIDLEQIEENVFRAQNEDSRMGRVFGGQVAAQALMATCRTVESWLPHSLHGYFLRGGDPQVPILLTVDRIRDGRSFATRRVVAVQRGRAIFNMSVSFHGEEPGFDHAAFEVEDIQTLTETLKSKGVEFKMDLFESPVCHMAVALDSEGNSFMLHQLKN